MNEKRKLPEDIMEEIKDMKDTIGGMEFSCAVIMSEIDKLITEGRRKGSVPENYNKLLGLLDNQCRILRTLERNTWDAIHTAEEEEEYAVIKLKENKSEKRMAFIHEGKVIDGGALAYDYMAKEGISNDVRIDVVGIDTYRTRQEAESAAYEYKKRKNDDEIHGNQT